MQVDNLRSEHIDEIVRLDKECYKEQSLTERQIDKMIKDINSSGFVLYDGKKEVIAYLIYLYNSKDFVTTVLRIGVKTSYRRKGMGTKLLNKVKDKIHANKPYILCNVSDINLVGQLFLRSQGFVARSINDEKPDDTYYEFIFRYEWKNDVFREDEVLGV